MHYLLRLKISDSIAGCDDLLTLYKAAVIKHNNMSVDEFFDAGFDLFCPTDIEVDGKATVKINQEVKGEMRFISSLDEPKGVPVCYYMYPRSSTGTKTPLRLANSVGIIDAGYRGNYISVFDNLSDHLFKVDRNQRLVQICPPNITYPMRVELVNNDEDLSSLTRRGEGGFGSTGK